MWARRSEGENQIFDEESTAYNRRFCSMTDCFHARQNLFPLDRSGLSAGSYN
jgi:hypothetical protein